MLTRHGRKQTVVAAAMLAAAAAAYAATLYLKLDAPVGPPPRARISPERVKRELQQPGYTLAAEHGFLPYQYFLVFNSDR